MRLQEECERGQDVNGDLDDHDDNLSAGALQDQVSNSILKNSEDADPLKLPD